MVVSESQKQRDCARTTRLRLALQDLQFSAISKNQRAQNNSRPGQIQPLEETIKIPATHVETVVDTTAAGDSFNGAYFSVRLKGGRVIDAAEAGCKLAAQVIQHSGAIVPTSPA